MKSLIDTCPVEERQIRVCLLNKLLCNLWAILDKGLVVEDCPQEMVKYCKISFQIIRS